MSVIALIENRDQRIAHYSDMRLYAFEVLLGDLDLYGFANYEAPEFPYFPFKPIGFRSWKNAAISAHGLTAPSVMRFLQRNKGLGERSRRRAPYLIDIPASIFSAMMPILWLLVKRSRRAMPEITSILENASCIGVCLGRRPGLLIKVHARSKMGAVHSTYEMSKKI